VKTSVALIGAASLLSLAALAAFAATAADTTAAAANGSAHDGDHNLNGFSKLDTVKCGQREAP
jgi:hypothetical protein